MEIKINSHDVARGVWNRDAPIERGPRHGQIAELILAKPREDLVAPACRLDERRVTFDVLDEPSVVPRLPEEIGLLLHLLQGLAADGVEVVRSRGVRLRHERLLADVVPALVGVQVDIPVRLGHLEQFPASRLVLLGSGPVVHVVANLRLRVESLERVDVLIAQFDRRHTSRLRGLRDLLPVLIRPCLEIDLCCDESCSSPDELSTVRCRLYGRRR